MIAAIAHSLRLSGLTVVISLCASVHVDSQITRMRISQLSVDQGLSFPQVNYILQDTRGFMWFATADGLNRYDGRDFTVFRPSPPDSTSLSSEYVNVLLEDKYGDLWINAASSLHRVDRVTGKIVRCLPGEWVTCMYEDTSQSTPSETMWFGSLGGGLHRFDRTKGTFAEYRHDPGERNSISSDSVFSVFVDHGGTLWIGTANGLNSLDRSRLHFTYYPHGPLNHVNELCEDPDTSVALIWICTDEGLYAYDTVAHSFTCYRNVLGKPGGMEDNKVWNVYIDSKERVWVGMMGGIARFDRSTRRYTSYQTDVHLNPWGHVERAWQVQEERNGTMWMAGDGLKRYDESKNRWIDMLYPQAAVLSMLQDNVGTMWIGTQSGGLFKIDRAEKQFENFTHQPGDSTSLNTLVVNGVCEDDSGMLWVGTPFGLDRLDPATGIFKHFTHDRRNPKSLSDNAAVAVLKDSKGKLWVGTGHGALEEFDESSGGFVHHKYDIDDAGSLNENYGVRSLYEDRRGTLWAGVGHGLLEEYNRTSRAFRHHQPSYPTVDWGYIKTIFEDSQGVLWFGGLGCGLNSYDRKADKFAHFVSTPNTVSRSQNLSNNSVQVIYEDHQGTLWIGTRVGLDKYDRGSGTFTVFTVRDGLASDNISGILEDDHGRLWLGTAKGISRFDPRAGTFRNYDAGDGVKCGECLTSYRSKSGQMYFGGTHGFVRFHPDSIRDNPNIPRIVLTSFKKSNIPVSLDTAITEKKSVQLSYRDYEFSFEFAALNFTNPEKNQYAYKLEPFDRDWVYCGTRRVAAYTNLDGGTYVFHVKGSNNDGIWNETGASIMVIITPPFWATLWFRILSFAMVLLCVGGALRYIEMRKIKKTIERLKQERALERERTRISQDMHDEVGSSLSEIAILSALAKKKPEESEAHIQEISELASEVIDNVSEIVWAMNPRNDTLDNLVAHLRRYAVKYLNLSQIRCRFDAPENVPPHHLTAEVRRNIFLVVKEALHNIVKHAHAREVSVTVKLDNRSLEILIEDNGRGFDMDESAESGNGLGNMNKRMADIGGVLTMISRPDHGTRVAMRLSVISPQ